MKLLNKKVYNLGPSTILGKLIINHYLNLFWSEVFSTITSNENPKYLNILFQVNFKDETLGYRTIGHLRKVNFSDKKAYIDYISHKLGVLNDAYKSNEIASITISYIITEGPAPKAKEIIEQS